MKLYTEKDVTEMILKTRKFGFTAEYLIITTEGISLPSDEKIESKAESFSVGFPISPNAECGEAYRLGLFDGYINGCKMVIDKIKNQQ